MVDLSDRGDLERILWNIANNLRGKMDANEYKSYMLGFIFLKFISDKLELFFRDRLIIQGKIFENLVVSQDIKVEVLKTYGYYLSPHLLYGALLKKTKLELYILDDLHSALQEFELSVVDKDAGSGMLGLFDDINLSFRQLGKTNEDINYLISTILMELEVLSFDKIRTKQDILGDAYEYLLGQFASEAGKKSGEFYTPPGVSSLLARIVSYGKKRIDTIYDPTCGSGSLLLYVAKHAKVSKYYGQEINNKTYNLARMNMLLHEVSFNNFDIVNNDVLSNPAHLDLFAKGFKGFEAVVANPPFSANWEIKDSYLNDERFKGYGGKLAPRGKADYAFILHMLYCLSVDGVMAVVVPHGVLFRQASEGVIRRYIIEKYNYLDAVIGLPSNLFYGTSIPTVVLIFKKKRKNNRIFFIDASREFRKIKKQNMLLDENIAKIVDTYVNRKVIDNYSYDASLSDIENNDYNLNISRYIDISEDEEEINLDEVVAEINKLSQEIKEVNVELITICNQLGISSPLL